MIIIGVAKDIVGTRVGIFDVLYKCDYRHKNGRPLYRVRCSICGGEFDKLYTDIDKATICKHKRWNNERIHYIFRGMKRRCYAESAKSYPRYGGRGIKICDEWLNNPPLFEKWSLENGYTDDLSIDRIDVNGDYCPENCRWVTMKENVNNKDSVRHIEVNGMVKNGNEWDAYLGFSGTTINTTCRKYGEEMAKELIRKRMENPDVKSVCCLGWLRAYELIGPLKRPGQVSRQRIAIRQLKDGFVVAEYNSIQDAYTKSGISKHTVEKYSKNGGTDIYGYTWERITKQEKA